MCDVWQELLVEYKVPLKLDIPLSLVHEAIFSHSTLLITQVHCSSFFLLFVRRLKRWKDFTHSNTKTLINRTSDGLVERVIMCFSPELFCYMYVLCRSIKIINQVDFRCKIHQVKCNKGFLIYIQHILLIRLLFLLLVKLPGSGSI